MLWISLAGLSPPQRCMQEQTQLYMSLNCWWWNANTESMAFPSRSHYSWQSRWLHNIVEQRVLITLKSRLQRLTASSSFSRRFLFCKKWNRVIGVHSICVQKEGSAFHKADQRYCLSLHPQLSKITQKTKGWKQMQSMFMLFHEVCHLINTYKLYAQKLVLLCSHNCGCK